MTMSSWIPDVPPIMWDSANPATKAVPLLLRIENLMAGFYLTGTTRSWRRRQRWWLGRRLCFLLGCTAMSAGSELQIMRYRPILFSEFTFRQLTLTMAIPLLFIPICVIYLWFHGHATRTSAPDCYIDTQGNAEPDAYLRTQHRKGT